MDKQPIRAIFNGVQQAAEPFELWTILEPIEGHPQYSTLSRRTIEAHGYRPVEEGIDNVKV
jgi:hypothetical protein